MRVLILTNNLKTTSGWGRYSREIVSELKKRNIDLLVLTESSTKSFVEEKNILKSANSFINFFKNIIIVRKQAKDFKIIHAFDGFPYALYGYFAVLGTPKKLFINGVGTYSVAPFNNFFKGFFLRLAYQKAKKIFCISNYTRKKILEKVKCQAITVLLGPPAIPKPKFNLEEMKVKYGIANHYPIFLTVGEIKPRKGQWLSLQAIAKLQPQYPDFRYFIIGGDSNQKYCSQIRNFIKEKGIEENVKIIPSISDDNELAFFYTIGDIFIMTSTNANNHFEGFGLVFLESYQFGKPAIGSADCGIEDAIKTGYTGYLARQNDVDDIYEKILKLLKRDQEEMRRNCFEFVKQFSWEKTVDQYLKYYYLK